MSEKDLKSSAVSGTLWTGAEKLVRQVVTFAIGIALARLLAPEDYGIVAMTAIFIAVAQTFTDSGLTSALIQKKECTDADYSTIFFFNIAVACSFYLALYLTAPYIADFYRLPVLKSVIRVVALSIVISGLNAVQYTRLTKDLRFRTQSLISLVSMVVTGITGLTLAFYGWGVWALVIQSLAGQICSTICVWVVSRWVPKRIFSKDSFFKLWGFGSKLLCSSLINTIYQNIYTLVIGKMFAPVEVGYFNRANQYAVLPSQTLTDVALKVNYPILSKIQDDDAQLLKAYQKLLRTPLFVLYPVLAMIAATAEPLIEVMIGSKWLPCAPYLRILCIGYMFTPLTHINLNLLYVKGRSDLVLKLELIKKPISFFILVATIPFGIYVMIVGRAAYEFVAFSFNCYYTGKMLCYGELQQLKVLIPIFINVLIMAMMTYFTMGFFDLPIAKLFFGTVVGLLSFLLFSVFTKDESFKDIIDIVCSRLKRIDYSK